MSFRVTPKYNNKALNQNYTANIITSIRILISILLLFCPTLSPTFYTLYLIAGLSDIIDGAIARKTNSASEFGSKLDTFADLIFMAVCLIKLLSKLVIPIWLYSWIAIIATIKLNNIVLEYIKRKKFLSVHSIMNKVTGLMLFIFPLTLTFIDLNYSLFIICIIATVAAIQESYSAFSKSPN